MRSWNDLISLACEKGVMISIAESCTGGSISAAITDIPGASNCFIGAIISYSNEMKKNILEVEQTVLDVNGAVSKETAEEMVIGAMKRTGSDLSLSVTGIAGPEGGTIEKPIGTVFISVLFKDSVPRTEHHFYQGLDRKDFKEKVADRALELLMESLESGR